MYLIGAVVVTRLRHLLRPERRDRGDSPVPSSIIIAGLALLAVAVVGWAVARANGYMGQFQAPSAP